MILLTHQTNEYVQKVRDFAKQDNAEVIVVVQRLRKKLLNLKEKKKKCSYHELGIEESGLDQLIRAAYSLLGLATYFTAGVQEVRAWTFRKG